eukprot:1411308-Karenia_brevis.AAC.1
MRSLVGASAFTDTGGRSLTMSYLLHADSKLDPAFAVHRAPLLAWASAAWDRRVPLSIMRGAFNQAAARQGAAKNPWATVKAPA